jgi:hypothetical protein
MTTATPAPPQWDEERLRAAVRAVKPFTPGVRAALERLFHCARAYARASEQYNFEAATTGAPKTYRLRKTITDLARARRQALIAMGRDPEASDVFPAAPTIPEKD